MHSLALSPIFSHARTHGPCSAKVTPTISMGPAFSGTTGRLFQNKITGTERYALNKSKHVK